MQEIEEYKFEGIIENRSIKEGPGWTNVAYTLKDGNIYSTFDEELRNFKKGDHIKGTHIKKGKYNNITSAELLDGQFSVTEEIVENEHDTKVPQSVWDAKERKVIRQNCNRHAVELLKIALEKQLVPTSDLASILQVYHHIAKQLEDWIYEDL